MSIKANGVLLIQLQERKKREKSYVFTLDEYVTVKGIFV